MQKHYTYTHSTPDGRIFYVGQGLGSRATNKSMRKPDWHEQAKNGRIVTYLVKNVDKELAELCEIEAIDIYKRRGHYLINKTLGGPGALGNKHTKETKRKMSISRMGNKNSLGHKQSAESQAKRSASLKATWAKRKGEQIG